MKKAIFGIIFIVTTQGCVSVATDQKRQVAAMELQEHFDKVYCHAAIQQAMDMAGCSVLVKADKLVPSDKKDKEWIKTVEACNKTYGPYEDSQNK